MGENKAVAKETSTEGESKAAKGAKVTKEHAPHAQVRAEKKQSRWTLAICKKTARRFATKDEWKVGAPSCFKSAQAHGWVEECCAGMSNRAKAPVGKKNVATRAAS